MPGQQIDPRTTTIAAPCKRTANHRHHRRTKQPRSARYWFPNGFFDPSDLNAAEFATVTTQQPLLNAIADYIEALSRELHIPLTIDGGILHHAKRTLGFVIHCDPAIRQNIPAHREFTRRLKATFPCHTAGMDADRDLVWLCQLDPAAMRNPSSPTPAFDIMASTKGASA